MNANRWRLDGQLALVTGASAGIGLAIARELAALGADLLLVAREEDPLLEARDELADRHPAQDFQAMAADVADDGDRQALLDWAEDQGDGLHILVNNAGGNITKPAVDYTEDEWRGIFETNLFSAFELSRYAHPLLARHPASCIVNVGSVSGITHVRSGAPYGMTKAALHQLTRNLAAEWAPDGIRVNAVFPGPVETPMLDAATQARLGQKGRLGKPHEIADAIAFLVSDQASYITGSELVIDGGQTLRIG